jgi:hypothetical protein
MVDYSKFDKLAAELSDEDEAGGNRPRVTRLQAGSKVTLSASGAVVSEPGRGAASAQPKASNLPHVRLLAPVSQLVCPPWRATGLAAASSGHCQVTSPVRDPPHSSPYWLRRLASTTAGGTSSQTVTGESLSDTATRGSPGSRSAPRALISPCKHTRHELLLFHALLTMHMPLETARVRTLSTTTARATAASFQVASSQQQQQQQQSQSRPLRLRRLPPSLLHLSLEHAAAG